MTEARAIRANFSDWRTVKSRKSLQLIFEVPLEQQAEVLKMLGAPLPDSPQWCGIALLQDPDEEPKPVDPRADAARERGRQAYAMSDAMEKARTRAVLLCKDVKFRKWIARDIPEIAVASVDMAEDILRAELKIQSRREIATNERAFRAFVAMESDYLSATGQMAEQRG